MQHSDYPKPSLTVDLVMFLWDGNKLYLPLVQRLNNPFKGYWALPGGFVEIDETLRKAAAREAQEEIGVVPQDLIEGPAFDDPHRDPRGRVISIPFACLSLLQEVRLQAGSDASKVQIFDLQSIPDELAFDHGDIISTMCICAIDAIRKGLINPEWLSSEDKSKIILQLQQCGGKSHDGK